MKPPIPKYTRKNRLLKTSADPYNVGERSGNRAYKNYANKKKDGFHQEINY